MIALLDTDILIDIALDRQPFSDDSAAVLDAAQRGAFTGYIAWHSISNFYYIVESTAPEQTAKNFIVDLLSFVEVSSTTTNDAIYATKLDLLILKMPYRWRRLNLVVQNTS